MGRQQQENGLTDAHTVLLHKPYAAATIYYIQYTETRYSTASQIVMQ